MPNSALAPKNRRRFGRRPCNFEAWIIAPARPDVVCTLVNLGSGGALLRLRQPGWLPFKLILAVPDLELRIDCEIRHQRGTSLGVQFAQAIDMDAIGPIHGPRELPYWMGGPKPAA